MIVYFADRKLNILGQASTTLPKGLLVTDDTKDEDVESGVAVFECEFGFDAETRAKIESCVEVGNYILRKHDQENEFYTIIDSEIDTKKQTAFIYAEDAGLDLLNEIVGPYEADKAYPINHYVEQFAYDSGFVIGINEAASLTRKLIWDGEDTVTARLASVATQFDGCEISFSYEIERLRITKKIINIYKKRGKDIGTTLRLNKEIDNIVVKKTIVNVATALRATGGTPEDTNTEDDIEPVPITLRGYNYDDGDFYVDGDTLKCRSALKKWSRYINPTEQNLKEGHEGHIVRPYSYDTTSQAELCAHTLTELKKLIDAEVNYEADILYLPENTKIGDRVNIVDEAGELFLSTRLLQLKTSVVRQEQKATLGEFLIKTSGISEKVLDLAKQFAINSQSAKRALAIAKNATANAEAAQNLANSALADAEKATQAAAQATTAANTATQSAQQAAQKADNAQAAVGAVQESVTGLEQTIANAEAAAEQAKQAAQTAETKAEEAKQSAQNAQAKAEESANAASNANTKAEEAKTVAEEAKTSADKAIADAEAAATKAIAAKLDAQTAQREIDTLGDRVTTLSNTMSVEYARKTDLTEAEASLQTQISQNAAGLESTAKKVQKIDETANDAHEILMGALAWAEKAQEEADQATADAVAAQIAADEAAEAAANAQAEADTAQEAADTAKTVADQAEADLLAAQEDLATVQSRADATEEEIAEAQEAVETARQAANAAIAVSITAKETAAQAQAVADATALKAASVLELANKAANEAALAQSVADEAKGDATAAQNAANQAAEIAAQAQQTAKEAVENADNAQSLAINAAKEAETAERNAIDALARADQYSNYLATARQKLADVLADVDATEAEVAAAEADVANAQEAAEVAQAEADTAQAAADIARENAIAAEEAADAAQTAADEAQQAASEAKKAAYQAQGVVYGLEYRTTNAETHITQNAEKIALMATKKEVKQTLGGYYTKEETKAEINLTADEINLSIGSKIESVTDEVASVSEAISALNVNADNISANVTEVKASTEAAIESVNSNIETLTSEVSAKMNAEAVEIEIQKAIENGTSKVVTKTGFTFDDDGMTVQKSGSEMKTQITEDGMTVYQNDEATLTANNKGVDARNLHATTYLIVGGRSRFENYGTDRTGCFWIGG